MGLVLAAASPSPSNSVALFSTHPTGVFLMNRFATIFVAFGLATAGSTALAEQAKDPVSKQNPKPQPVQMTEAQMDNVAGGALVADGNLIAVQLQDVASHNNVQVAVPVTAAVGNVGVLSGPQVADVMAAQRGGQFGLVR
jgi:hypothetical protein